MAMRLRFEGSPQCAGGAATRAWHASERWHRAILRNIEAGVLAIMLLGCVLAAGEAAGDAVTMVRAAGQATQSHVAVAGRQCVAPEDARRPPEAAM